MNGMRFAPSGPGFRGGQAPKEPTPPSAPLPAALRQREARGRELDFTEFLDAKGVQKLQKKDFPALARCARRPARWKETGLLTSKLKSPKFGVQAKAGKDLMGLRDGAAREFGR